MTLQSSRLIERVWKLARRLATHNRYFSDLEDLQAAFFKALCFYKAMVCTRLKFIPLLACLPLIASCSLAYKEEGAIDYRKAEILSPLSTLQLKCEEDGKIMGLSEFNAENYQGEPVRVARLERKNAAHPPDLTATFSDRENIVVRLVSAYIEDYTEGPLSWFNDMVFDGQIIPRGEIAIVADVFPVAEKVAFDFSPKAVDAGRVIFYSDDIAARQFMNFNNMPIYGPSSEGKDGIGFAIWILELDISDPILGNLLRTLSSFGDKPLIDASSGNIILKSLGKTLAESKGHDVNFLYRGFLEPKDGSMLPNSFLEVGYYVFIRVHDFPANRSHDIDWSKLVFDENSGRLYKEPQGCSTSSGGCCGKYEEYKDRNYLVVKVDKDTSGRDLKVENEMFKDFTKALQDSANHNALISEITAKVKLRNLLRLFVKANKAREEQDADAAAKRVALNQNFRAFWERYVEASLVRQLAPANATPQNINDLTKPQLEHLFGEFAIALSSEGVSFDDCIDSFTWSSEPRRENLEAAGTRVEEIRRDVLALLLGGECHPDNN